MYFKRIFFYIIWMTLFNYSYSIRQSRLLDPVTSLLGGVTGGAALPLPVGTPNASPPPSGTPSQNPPPVTSNASPSSATPSANPSSPDNSQTLAIGKLFLQFLSDLISAIAYLITAFRNRPQLPQAPSVSDPPQQKISQQSDLPIDAGHGPVGRKKRENDNNDLLKFFINLVRVYQRNVEENNTVCILHNICRLRPVAIKIVTNYAPYLMQELVNSFKDLEESAEKLNIPILKPNADCDKLAPLSCSVVERTPKITF